MTIDLDELERLAKAAKKGKRKGDWKWDGREVDGEGFVFIPDGSALVGLIQLGDRYEGYQSDCDFMQAASPWDVLALVQRVRKAENALRGAASFVQSALGHAEWCEAGRKGMLVPYHGPFAQAVSSPAVVRDLRELETIINAGLEAK